jgi:arylsulfatase A-like enzyme
MPRVATLDCRAGRNYNMCMHRSRVVLLVVVVLMAAMAAVYFLGRRPAAPQYVILIFMDAVRPDHLSCYGYERETSPRIDALARRGALFEDAVAQAPWTLSSVASVMTSTFPSQHGAKRLEGRNVPMKAGEETFVEILAGGGYRTCAMSTAKLYTPSLGLDQGFQESYIIGGEKDVLEKVAAMQLADAAVTWLRGHRDERCFLVLHHYDTHYPYRASAACINRFDPGYNGEYRLRFGDSSLRILKAARAGRISEIGLTEADITHIKALYDCEIVRTDASVGALVDSLEAWGRLDRAMIIITADHGEEFLEHGSIEHGQTLYDESLRVPLVVFAPSCVDEGSRIPEQVGLMDLGPTVLQSSGIPVPDQFEGRSLMPLMSSRFEAAGTDVRPGGLPYSCYVAESICHRPERKALRCPPYKLIFDPFFGTTELYNINADPLETQNLAGSRPDMAEQMLDVLLTAMGSYYPGGWGIAWRGADTGPGIEGSIQVPAGLIETAGHNILAELDSDVDALATSHDRKQVTFRSRPSPGWEGVELRMAGPGQAGFDIRISGRASATVQVGNRMREVSFPVTLKPDEARLDRRDLARVFADTAADLVIFWVDPGSQPTALDEKQAELRRKLKAIGYVD